MCGFVALIGGNNQENKSYIDLMLDEISHRGPDGRGKKCFDEKTNFGHVRLAILDIDHGYQPMVSQCGRYLLVFNGEIYNFEEHRKELICRGHKFRGNCDSEVLLALLINEGKDCLNKLNGMFAFVFYDKVSGEWLAARDHFGIKPIYYCELQNGIAFASEIKALLKHPEIKRNLNIQGLNDYLTFQFVLGENTLFEGIRKIEPACYLKGNINTNKEIDIKKWWGMDYSIDYEHSKSWFQEKLSFLIQDSIKLQTISDYPIGTYLSGGIDSSLISSITAKHLGKELKSFHGKFKESIDYDESRYALMVAEFSNISLFETIPSSTEFVENLPLIIKALDEPIAGPGVFPQFMVSKLASKYIKVVLGGQGGDELFGGYARYLIAYFEQALKGSIEETQEEGNHLVNLSSIINNLPLLNGYQPLMKKFWSNGLFESMNKRYYHLISRINKFENPFQNNFLEKFDDNEQFNRFNNIFESPNTHSYINKMTAFDLKTLLPALLQIEDRVSMHWGLEARVPLLDYRIAELVASIPPQMKFQGGRTKAILKDTAKSFLPESIIKRKDKMGFPVPLNNWMQKNSFKDFISDILLSQKSLQRGIYEPSYTRSLVENQSGPGSRGLWGSLCLELWFNEFIDV